MFATQDEKGRGRKSEEQQNETIMTKQKLRRSIKETMLDNKRPKSREKK